MIQALLAARFQMKLHRDTKEFPVYALAPGKGGLKMKESPLDPDADSGEAAKGAVNVTASGGRGGTTVNFGRGSSFTFANNRFEGRKLTMASFADMLARFVDRPVVNMTELTGNYDFTLELSPEDFRAMMIRSAIAAGVVLPPQTLQLLDVSGDSLFTALQTTGLNPRQARPAPVGMVNDYTDREEKQKKKGLWREGRDPGRATAVRSRLPGRRTSGPCRARSWGMGSRRGWRFRRPGS